MNRREAKREAYRWVAELLDGALSNGLLALGEDEIENENDRERVVAGMEEIRDEMHRRGRAGGDRG